MMVDALSQKSVSIGSLDQLRVSRKPLARDIRALEIWVMQFGASKKGRDLDTLKLISRFYDQTKAIKLRMKN